MYPANRDYVKKFLKNFVGKAVVARQNKQLAQALADLEYFLLIKIMTVDLATQLISQMLWTAVMVATPILGVALVVGLTISIFQVITQVQEMSLTFIPKLAAVVTSMLVLGPWMIKKVMGFATKLIANIPGYF